MYNVIQQIINHTWSTTTGNNDQQYIYYICGAMIVILAAFFLDTFVRFFRGVLGRK